MPHAHTPMHMHTHIHTLTHMHTHTHTYRHVRTYKHMHMQPSSFTYFLASESLNCVPEHSYNIPTGVLLTSSMSFFPYINNIVAKASKMLNFI